MPFILRGASLLGIHSVECPRPWREDIWAHLSTIWKPKHLDTLISREVTLEDLPAVCDEFIAGKIQGRTLVRLSGE